MNQPTDLCKSNPGFTKFSLEFDRNQNQPSQIQPWIYQNHTLTLLKFSLELIKIRPQLCQNQTLTLPKIKIRHQLYQIRTLSLEQCEFFCSRDFSVGDGAKGWRTKGTKCMSSHGWRWSLSSFWWSWWEPLCHRCRLAMEMHFQDTVAFIIY